MQYIECAYTRAIAKIAMSARTLTILGSALSLLALCVAQNTKDVVDCSPGSPVGKPIIAITFLYPCLPASNQVKKYEECDVFAYMALWHARHTMNLVNFGVSDTTELPRLLDCFTIVPGSDIATQVSLRMLESCRNEL